MNNYVIGWRSCFLFGTVLLLSGCGSLPGTSDGKAETLIDREWIDVVAADAGRQLTYLKDRRGNERFCRGPGPDFSRTASSGTSIGVPTVAGGALGVGGNLSRGALELGGRDPVVLIARELLYRACELAANTNADPATEREIYSKFLAAIIEIAKSHSGAGSVPLASEPSSALPVTVAPNPPRDSGGSPKNRPDYDPPNSNKDQ